MLLNDQFSSPSVHDWLGCLRSVFPLRTRKETIRLTADFLTDVLNLEHSWMKPLKYHLKKKKQSAILDVVKMIISWYYLGIHQ